MKYRIITTLALAAFAFNVFGVGFAKTASASSNDLAKLLPESDAVITLDSARLFNSALPQMLSANRIMLGKVTKKLDEIQDETGLDLRNFKEVALGVRTKTVGEKLEVEPVVLARGDVESKQVISVARLASKGNYQTRKIGNRDVYIFSAEEILEKNKSKKKEDDKNVLEKGLDTMFGGLSKELALTVYDENTVILGTLPRVKEMIGNAPRVSAEVLDLLNRNPTALASMGAILPTGISKFVKLSDDELGATLDSIREMQGSLDVNDGRALLSLMAKTLGDEQAQDLEGTLSGLRMLGKAVLGNSKGADKQVYARMVENAKISREANAVMFDLVVPKSDIDILVSKK